MSEAGPPVGVRLDRWLWAARLFRSRSLAATACDGGRVDVNGNRDKPHKIVRAGDIVAATVPGGTRTLRIAALALHRGPAPEARLLYEDLTPPPQPADAIDTLAPRRPRGAGRPTKRARRQLDRWRDL